MKKDYILITGGTKGIGLAIAKCLAKGGYNLLLTYFSDKKNADTISDMLAREYHVVVECLQTDCSMLTSIDVIEDFVKNNDLKFNSLIFNAGLTCRDQFEEMKPEEWMEVFNANLHFPVFMLQRIVNRVNKHGCIIFTGSLMGIEPHSVSLAYGVSKSAVHALVKNLVKFLSPKAIRVNAVAPGFVDTEWQKTKPMQIRRNIENKIAMNRFCSPEEIAEVYMMLINNNYINGEILSIDGGYSYK